MANRYWRLREEQNRMQNVQDEKAYDREINSIYEQAFDEIQDEINSFYGKYARKEGISMAEAKKRVSRLDIEAYERKAARYVAEKNFSDKANEEMRLYNTTMKINRLEMLKSDIALRLTGAADKADKYSGKVLTEATRKELERQAGILGSTVHSWNTQAAEKIVKSPFRNATYSERVWNNASTIQYDLEKELRRTLIQGKAMDFSRLGPFAKCKERAKADARRLMKTELTRCRSEAQKAEYEENGFDEYEFMCLGPNPCEICQGLNGKHFPVKDLTKNMGEFAPPIHPNCRCTTAPWVDEDAYNNWLNVKADGSFSGDFDEKQKDAFTPAKSVKEAEQVACQYFENDFMDRTFKGKASYTGISLEHANQINRTLEELTEKYPDAKKIAGIKSIDPSSAKGKKIFTSEDAVMAYDPIQHGVYINRKVLKDSASLAKYNADSSEAWDIVINNLDKLSGTQRQVAQRYKDAGRALVGDGSVKDYLTHEYGHHVAWEWLDAKTNNALGVRMNKYAPKLSGYATASKNEYLAESFVAYNKGELGKIDPEYSKAIRKLNGGNISNTSRNMKPVMVNYSTKNIPTLLLPKNEYAHVMSELNTNLTKEQLKQPVVLKAIGNYIYTVEINGFDDYRIIGKREIDI